MSAFHRLGRGWGGGKGGKGRGRREGEVDMCCGEIGIVSPQRKEERKITSDYNKRLDRGWRPRREGRERKGRRREEEAEEMRGSRNK
jgi:hypothetical protein